MIAADFGAHQPASQLAELVVEYIDDCRARGLRPQTIEEHYQPGLGRFLTWCEASDVRSPAQLTQHVVNRFTIHLQQTPSTATRRPLAPQTVRNRVEVVNAWLRWLHKHEDRYLERDVRGRKPQVPKRAVQVLSPEEVKRMLAAAARRPTGVRDHLIIGLLWETAVRVGELSMVRLGDIVKTSAERNLRINPKEEGGGSKGIHGRWVPLPTMYAELRRYIDHHRPESASDRIILQAKRNERTGMYEPLGEEGIQNIVQWVAREAGIGRRVHPHLFRHSAATYWLEPPREMNPMMVAEILGHADLKQLYKTYGHLSSLSRFTALRRVLEGDQR